MRVGTAGLESRVSSSLNLAFQIRRALTWTLMGLTRHSCSRISTYDARGRVMPAAASAESSPMVINPVAINSSEAEAAEGAELSLN